MKLYLLKQTDNNGYDTYDSCIVCAENEEDAKTISPDSKYINENGIISEDYTFIENKEWSQWAIKKEFIICEEIGEANSNQGRGVVLASYNAG